MLQEKLGVSDITAMKILITLENHGIIEESDTEGEYTVVRTRALNAVDENRDIQLQVNIAVRYMRDIEVMQKNDLEQFCIVLGVNEAKAIELLEMIKALGVIEEVPMYRALSADEVTDRGQNWYDPYNSSVQRIDAKGNAPIIHKVDYDDSMYPEVERYVIEQQKASASLLQRQFKIGYSRAARLIDALEENAIVSPPEGRKPRRVLKKKPNSDTES